MYTDCHCHPYDLAEVFKEYDEERKRLGVLAAASSCFIEELEYINDSFIPCFAIHPQLPAMYIKNNELQIEKKLNEHLQIINNLAKDKKISAIGECGFDLFNDLYKETESYQDKIFASQLEIALQYDLPIVLHVRKAMFKIFKLSKFLSKCKSVIFHSWSGTYEEAASLLNCGVNAYFSFGNTIKLNHKQAIRSCSLLPADRLLTETDAPYQPQRGKQFSSWSDLPLILETAAALRSTVGNIITKDELEKQIELNFRKVFH
ncbi:MAG: TatD family hydrolase [Treponema sp.]|nr:TatD family hydrolase [Treponema sp.]